MQQERGNETNERIPLSTWPMSMWFWFHTVVGNFPQAHCLPPRHVTLIDHCVVAALSLASLVVDLVLSHARVREWWTLLIGGRVSIYLSIHSIKISIYE